MKVIVIGETGTIGSAVARLLSKEHEVVPVSRHSDISVDITDRDSIKKMYETIGVFDALVSTAGALTFKPLSEMTDEDFNLGFQSKLMGQVRLVQEGAAHISKNGSFTLISGILSHQPILSSVSASMVNAALEGFVRSASLELREQARVNLVSPTIVTESLDKYGDYFKGFKSVAVKEVARAFLRSVSGIETGKIYHLDG